MRSCNAKPTQEVCEEGMPPDRMTCVKSHLASAYQCVSTFKDWAITKATNPATQGLQLPTSVLAEQLSLVHNGERSMCVTRIHTRYAECR